MNRLGLVALWLTATVAVTLVAFQVVGAAESQVGERPLTPVVAIDEPEPGDAVDPAPTTTLTTMVDPTAPTTTPGSTVTTAAPATTTPTTTPTTTVPTTTAGDGGTSAGGWTTLNVPTAGGTVTVEHRPEEVRLVAVTARSGFSVGHTELGPPEVRVEFDSPGLQVRVDVEWGDDGPKVEIEEEHPDDD